MHTIIQYSHLKWRKTPHICPQRYHVSSQDYSWLPESIEKRETKLSNRRRSSHKHFI